MKASERRSGVRRAAIVTLAGAGIGLVAGCGWIRVEGSPPPASAPQSATGPSRAAPPSAGGDILVQRGDTLYSIARRNNIPLRGLIAANDLQPPYTILPGDRLRLPPPPQMHVVRPGETVYGISRQYGVDVTSVVKANGIEPPYTIVVGQALVVPEGDLDGLVAEAPATIAPPQSDRSVESRPLPPPDASSSTPPETSPGPGTPLGTRAPDSSPAAPPPTASASAPARAEELPSGPVRFIRPLDGRILSSYGPKSGGLHNDGVNIAAPRGSTVRAAEAGVVAYAGNELPGFGNLILLKHAEGWTTAYGHNDALLVRRGDRVARGQTIARVGSSGNVSNPQLHFEIRRGARAVDPMPYFQRAEGVSALPAEHEPVSLNLVAFQPAEKAQAE